MTRNRILATTVIAFSMGLTVSADAGQATGTPSLGSPKDMPAETQAQATTIETLAAPESVLSTCRSGPSHQRNFGWSQSQALIDEGWNHAFNERGEEALAAFVTAVHVGPERPEPYWGLGVAAFTAGLDNAVIDACFVRTIAMLPDVAAVRADYGNILSLRERWQEAIAAYEIAIALDDSFIHAYDGLSAALLAIGDRAGAEAAHARSWELRGH